jgi:thiol-disulfide isomerase/thioredoxin
MHKRLLLLTFAFALVATACGSSSAAAPANAPTPVTYDALISEITTSGHPTVVNSWAAWCPPCRSEAPLLATAATTNEDVEFIMLNTNDNPTDAAQFIGEAFSGVPMTHYEDKSGAVTFELGGGRGLPVTFFYDASGEVVQIHRGILDEPTLAFYLDEIKR